MQQFFSTAYGNSMVQAAVCPPEPAVSSEGRQDTAGKGQVRHCTSPAQRMNMAHTVVRPPEPAVSGEGRQNTAGKGQVRQRITPAQGNSMERAIVCPLEPAASKEGQQDMAGARQRQVATHQPKVNQTAVTGATAWCTSYFACHNQVSTRLLTAQHSTAQACHRRHSRLQPASTLSNSLLT